MTFIYRHKKFGGEKLSIIPPPLPYFYLFFLVLTCTLIYFNIISEHIFHSDTTLTFYQLHFYSICETSEFLLVLAY